ncbi:MAG TPA: replicative DNA helicase, partial [Rickettsia endosymbiont of Omalisus fontisbellaquei]|nr:replicative DNA helicase [Rickettsia endosymbiont of Omalisus fontisbellaquei]
SHSLRTGELSRERQYELQEQANIISKLPFHIDDSPGLSISTIRMRARRLKRKKNLGILFVDYLHLIKGVGKFNNKVEELAEITQGLKAIAKELDIPVIVLSQLSRAVENREDKKPLLSDLRESGAIEQDADIVMFIYREEYYLSRREPSGNDIKHGEWLDKISKAHNKAEIIIAKHRNGQIGSVELHYDSKYSKFNDLAKNY